MLSSDLYASPSSPFELIVDVADSEAKSYFFHFEHFTMSSLKELFWKNSIKTLWQKNNISIIITYFKQSKS